MTTNENHLHLFDFRIAFNTNRMIYIRIDRNVMLQHLNPFGHL